MTLTAEISNYPLDADFEPIILDFINRCKKHDVTVKVNATSTHIQGEYDLVMQVIKDEMRTSYERFGMMIFVIKYLQGELNLDFSM